MVQQYEHGGAHGQVPPQMGVDEVGHEVALGPHALRESRHIKHQSHEVGDEYPEHSHYELLLHVVRGYQVPVHAGDASHGRDGYKPDHAEYIWGPGGIGAEIRDNNPQEEYDPAEAGVHCTQSGVAVEA